MLLLTYSGINSSGFGCSELHGELRYLLPPSFTSCLEGCCLVMKMLNFFPPLLSSFFFFCKSTHKDITHWGWSPVIQLRHQFTNIWSLSQGYRTREVVKSMKHGNSSRIMRRSHRHSSYVSHYVKLNWYRHILPLLKKKSSPIEAEE